jgi:hypothetical protein
MLLFDQIHGLNLARFNIPCIMVMDFTIFQVWLRLVGIYVKCESIALHCWNFCFDEKLMIVDGIYV